MTRLALWHGRSSVAHRPAPIVDDRAVGRAPAERTPVMENMLARARAFAEPLLAGRDARHRRGRAGACRRRGRDPAAHGRLRAMQAASYLVYRPIPEAAGGSDRQGLRRQLRRAGGRNHQAGAGAEAARRPPRRRIWPTAPARRPSACARCCWRSRATCAWCCCAWPRACRRCACTPPASEPCPRAWRASRCRCSRRWPTGWASGRSSGSSRTCRSASCSPRLQAHRAPARREARRARGLRRAVARSASSSELRGAGHRGRGAGPAEAHLQHLEEDARQGARLRPGVRHRARCA